MKTKETAMLGLFTALAMILSWIDSLLPIAPGVPGIKAGLASIAVMFVLKEYGLRKAMAVQAARIVLTSLLFGNFAALAYSLAGGVLSLLVMALILKTGKFSLVSASAAGGTAHNLGQLAAASVLMQSESLLCYLPVLVIAGAALGTVSGLIAVTVTERAGKMK